MTRKELIDQIRKKKTFLCVGLDPDVEKLPEHLTIHPDAIFEFCKAIVNATHPYCVAFKPNAAFFEAHGTKGWDAMERINAYIRKNYPQHFLIADAKRGDIGNTSAMYARTFLTNMDCDAITVAPYMGEDSVKPFLIEGKWVILLALTSNYGSSDFQNFPGNESAFDDRHPEHDQLYKYVLKKAQKWGDHGNMMFVVGATRAEMLKEIRSIVPDHFLLVPGVGAQGGSLEEVVKYGLTKDIGLLVNASRSVLYASAGKDFADRAAREALALQQQMEKFIS